MAILTGSEIKRQYELGNIFISDFNESRLGPNSYDVTLSDELIEYDVITLNSKEENPCHKAKIDPKYGFKLMPGRLYLGRTNERVKTNGF